MKKNLLLAGLLTTFSLVAKSQVGINTPNPAATLDVTAKNSTGTATSAEGLLIPRVDRQRAQSMAGVPVSTLIYVNSIATGTAAGTALNIDTVGYYYYNGTVWTKLNLPVNIYNADGTLTGNRTVTQGASTLAFTGTQTNAFSVDGNTLSVDAANDRVGLGTTTPDTKLTISTPDNSFGLNHTNGTANLKTYIGGGVVSLGTTTANDLRFMTNNAQKMAITSAGNVGINTTTPGTALDVNGAITNRETVLAVAGNTVSVPTNVSQVQLTGAATAAVAITAPAAPNAGQRLIVYNNTTGGFGATLNGVTVPSGKALEFVFSNSAWRSTEGGLLGAAPVNIYNADGTLTGNRTVTQGASTLAFTGTQTNAFSVDGNTLSVDAANDRVGLGTTTPDTKLTISTPDNNFGLNHTNGTVNLKTYIGGGAAYVGTTTSNNLNLTANNTVKMTITPAGNVGVGTSTPDNSALLDLNATNKGLLLPKVSLTSTADASTVSAPAKGLLVYNNNTAMSPQGEGIYYNGGTSTTPNWGKIGPVSKMYFKYYTFTNPAGDYIADFDTKISTASYTAIIVGFDTNNGGLLNAGFKNTGTSDFQSPDIYTFQKNGTWRIFADVPNASNALTPFVWGIRVLIISNEQMTTLSSSTINLGGSNTGSATASPVP